MNQYSAAVLLRNADGRTHSVCVVLSTASPEDAVTHAEHLALRTVWEQPGWSVESSWLFDQCVISAEYRGPVGGDPAFAVRPPSKPGDPGHYGPHDGDPAMQVRGAPFDEPRPGTDDWPNAHGRRLNENLEAY